VSPLIGTLQPLTCHSDVNLGDGLVVPGEARHAQRRWTVSQTDGNGPRGIGRIGICRLGCVDAPATYGTGPYGDYYPPSATEGSTEDVDN
jgi:hypothetical protein